MGEVHPPDRIGTKCCRSSTLFLASCIGVTDADLILYQLSRSKMESGDLRPFFVWDGLVAAVESRPAPQLLEDARQAYADGLADPDVVDLDPKPFVRQPKIGRNDPCPSGSGKKHKKCCGKG
jgi:hypothetical protein